MKKLTLMFVPFIIFALMLNASAKQKQDGNVYFEDDQGGKHFICPVMGNMAVVTEKTTFSDYDGQRYYFCCPNCKPEFEKNPEKYLSKLTLPGNVVETDDDVQYYICPVSGEKNKLQNDSQYTDYHSKRYYFCCADCYGKFKDNPKEYLKKLDKKMHSHHKMKMDHKCKDCDGMYPGCGM